MDATPMQEKYREKRMEVLRAAARVFGRLGFHRASLADVADDLGMTPAALYYYMKSKDELYHAASQVAVAHLTELLEADPGSPPLDRLKRFFRAYAAFIGEDFGRCLALTNGEEMPSPFREQGIEGRRWIDRRIRGMARQAAAEGAIAPCDEAILSSLLFGSFNGMARWSSPDGPLSAGEVADVMLDIVLNGLSRNGAADAPG